MDPVLNVCEVTGCSEAEAVAALSSTDFDATAAICQLISSRDHTLAPSPGLPAACRRLPPEMQSCFQDSAVTQVTCQPETDPEVLRHNLEPSDRFRL